MKRKKKKRKRACGPRGAYGKCFDKSSDWKYGDLIREWRINSNISQKKFGDKIGRSHSYVSKVESSLKIPSREIALKIEKLTGIVCECPKCGGVYKK